MKTGKDIAVLAVGSMVKICNNAISRVTSPLKDRITLINARFVKPLDIDMLKKIEKTHKYIITFEEGSKIGGFGDSVLRYFSSKETDLKIFTRGIEDDFIEQGTREELLESVKLNESGVVNYINSIVDTNEK